MALDLDGAFYPGYQAANPHFSPDTFVCAKETVSALLTTATTSENPGMLLGKVQSGKTRTFIMHFPEDDAPPFDWDAARAALTHLSQQHPKETERGMVLVWAAKDRNSARLAGESSHATYIETPDSEKTEGQLAKTHTIAHLILFLLRQDGTEEKGWRGTPFYWPVIRAQAYSRNH